MMPATKKPMPESFHMINNAFRRDTKPVKGKLFGSCNRALIPSSTGSGNPNWIIKRITPTTINQAQRGRFRHPLGVPEAYLPVRFLNPVIYALL
jgi:hypothetical protein